jgi:hypothetical protein
MKTQKYPKWATWSKVVQDHFFIDFIGNLGCFSSGPLNSPGDTPLAWDATWDATWDAA